MSALVLDLEFAATLIPDDLARAVNRFLLRFRVGNVDLAGPPRTVFKRALERGNLLVAEATAKEIGRISLAEALELTALVAEKTPERHGRFAARWLSCYLDELEPETLEEVGFVLGCLAALAGDERELALMSLRAVVKGRVRRGCG